MKAHAPLVDIEWEYPVCVLCGGSDRAASDSVSWQGVTFGYVLCRGCGLKYMYPRPTERWYHAFYERQFWQEKIEYRGFSVKSPQPRAAQEGLTRRLGKQRWRAERIMRIAGRRVTLDADCLVLDVGTAFGVTLHAIGERYGCRVAGVEPSAAARDYAERELGITFVGRYMEDLFAPTAMDGRVSLLIFSQTLENIVRSRAALAAARRLLRDGGYLYIDTSNFVYYNAINPYHPYIFSPDTLEDLLGQCGFEVVDREHEPPPAEAVAPCDPYLTFVARPGPSAFVRRRRPIEEIVAEQRLGLQKRAAAMRAGSAS